MARRRRRSEQRDNFSIATPPTPTVLLNPPTPSLRPYDPHIVSRALDAERRALTRTINLMELEDRRYWHPDPIRPPQTVPTRRSANRLSRRLIHVGSINHGLVGFTDPRRIVLCARRAMRRQVMFALRKTGKGAARKHRHRNAHSNIRC